MTEDDLTADDLPTDLLDRIALRLDPEDVDDPDAIVAAIREDRDRIATLADDDEVRLDDPEEPMWFCPTETCPPAVHTEDTSEVNV